MPFITRLFKAWLPTMTAESVFTVDFAALRRNGCRALLFDYDNTITPYGTNIPDERVKRLFESLGGMGFVVAFLSNNDGRRTRAFCGYLPETPDVKVFAKAKKPSTKALFAALNDMGVKPSETALIGDQIFTDVWCGNRAGTVTILTKPLCKGDEWTVKLKRPLEKPILYIIKKRII